MLSRLQEKEEVVLTDVSISEVTEKVAAEFRILAANNGLLYETEIVKDRKVKADEGGLRELVSIRKCLRGRSVWHIRMR